MKFYRSRFFLICICVAVALVLIPSALSIFGYTDLLRSGIKTVAKPFEWCGSRAAEAIAGFIAVFDEHDRLVAENEALKAKLEKQENQRAEQERLEAENAWLKEYLSLATEHPEYLLTDATIISRESGNYATVLTLNRGSVHGIKKKMPVLLSDGVFGHVSEVGLDWCKVVSIVESTSSASAYTERGGVAGVVEGDSLLRQEGMCRMTYIAADADIRVGDRVLTGGNGSIYPPGLLIGEITEIHADEYSRTLIAYIKPAVDFEDVTSLTRVMILTGYDTGAEVPS